MSYILVLIAGVSWGLSGLPASKASVTATIEPVVAGGSWCSMKT